jgi:hypothetical protein
VLPRILPLYPDELLYSWVARTGNLLNFRYRQDLVRYVFGHEDARPKVDLPNRLGFVAEASGNRLGNAYDLLAKTSLFPFYSPFLRAESRERIIAALIGNLGVAANKANALSMLRLEINPMHGFLVRSRTDRTNSDIAIIFRKLFQVSRHITIEQSRFQKVSLRWSKRWS